jgi:hypothetical protein
MREKKANKISPSIKQAANAVNKVGPRRVRRFFAELTDRVGGRPRGVEQADENLTSSATDLTSYCIHRRYSSE